MTIGADARTGLRARADNALNFPRLLPKRAVIPAAGRTQAAVVFSVPIMHSENKRHEHDNRNYCFS